MFKRLLFVMVIVMLAMPAQLAVPATSAQETIWPTGLSRLKGLAVFRSVLVATRTPLAILLRDAASNQRIVERRKPVGPSRVGCIG